MGEWLSVQEIGKVCEPGRLGLGRWLGCCMADDALACVAECGGRGGRDGGVFLALTQTAIGLIGPRVL